MRRRRDQQHESLWRRPSETAVLLSACSRDSQKFPWSVSPSEALSKSGMVYIRISGGASLPLSATVKAFLPVHKHSRQLPSAMMFTQVFTHLTVRDFPNDHKVYLVDISISVPSSYLEATCKNVSTEFPTPTGNRNIPKAPGEHVKIAPSPLHCTALMFVCVCVSMCSNKAGTHHVREMGGAANKLRSARVAFQDSRDGYHMMHQSPHSNSKPHPAQSSHRVFGRLDPRLPSRGRASRTTSDKKIGGKKYPTSSGKKHAKGRRM